MSDERAAWLTERLDDLERIAQGAIDQGGRGRRGEGTWAEVDPERMPGLIGDASGGVVAFEHRDSGVNRWRAAHIVASDPRSVLARVEADRQIAAAHARVESPSDPTRQLCQSCDALWVGMWPCPTFRGLLSAHRHAPGFREEWIG